MHERGHSSSCNDCNRSFSCGVLSSQKTYHKPKSSSNDYHHLVCVSWLLCTLVLLRQPTGEKRETLLQNANLFPQLAGLVSAFPVITCFNPACSGGAICRNCHPTLQAKNTRCTHVLQESQRCKIKQTCSQNGRFHRIYILLLFSTILDRLGVLFLLLQRHYLQRYIRVCGHLPHLWQQRGKSNYLLEPQSQFSRLI